MGPNVPADPPGGKSKGSSLAQAPGASLVLKPVSGPHLNQEHSVTAGGALVEPGGSYCPISTGWQEMPLKISKASDGLLREARNQDVSSAVFSDHQVS